MKMIRFDEEDIRFLAIELPDSVKHFKYSGDFEGEIREIRRLLEKVTSEAERKRLLIESAIAEGMKRDYHTDAESLLSAIVKVFPRANERTLKCLTEHGFADYIYKNGKKYYQNSAYRNIVNTCTPMLQNMKEDGTPGETEPFFVPWETENAEIMKKQGSRSVRHTVRFERRLKPEYIREGKPLTLHLPYPAICEEQTDIRLLSSSHDVYISDADHRTATIRTEAKKGDIYFTEFGCVNTAKYTNIDPERVKCTDKTFYTFEKLPQIRFSPYMRELAREISGGETSPYKNAYAIYRYITENISYSYMRDYLCIENIPEFACLNGRGDCGVQALVFITLCRILNIPAQWQSGCTARGDIGSHDWAKVYLEPYGWVPVDPSYGGGAFRRKDTAMRDFYFGNTDPYRIVTCNDIQVPFDPPKRYMRTDPYDNQQAELEYEDEGLPESASIGERILLSSEEL